jgi:Kef-type K+ transport system membrane component KefB
LHDSPLFHVAELLLNLSIILIFAKVGGEIAVRFIKIPQVLGELIAGIIISPFALGGIEILNFGPLFNVENNLPVSKEIFFLAQLGAVFLLFEVGIETNKSKFYSALRPSIFVALGGVILPFLFGFFCTILLGFANLNSIQAMSPALFVGAIMTATSIGITARVLSDINQLDSKEGITILGGAVVDDVLGIIILAIVIGIGEKGEISLSSVILITIKAFGFWIGLMILGSLISKRLSSFALSFKSTGSALLIASIYGLIASAVAEVYFGLAMIIGSYTMGLVLSDTELKHKVEKPISNINKILVPIFFCVVGMQLDMSFITGESDQSLSKIIIFTILLSILAIISKIFGSGIPAYFVGFDRKSSWKIGLGMLPRGEVAIIIAGIGLTTGVIGADIFGISLVVTIVTTILAPILLVRAYKNKK